LKQLKGFSADPEARAAVTKIREDLATAYREFGAVHLQIGKSYQYRDGLKAESYAVVQSIKNFLDPKCLINPGVLGLNSLKEGVV